MERMLFSPTILERNMEYINIHYQNIKLINGLQNQSIRKWLPNFSPASVSRILKRLRIYGIIDPFLPV
jgi:hypothetical protein